MTGHLLATWDGGRAGPPLLAPADRSAGRATARWAGWVERMWDVLARAV